MLQLTSAGAGARAGLVADVGDVATRTVEAVRGRVLGRQTARVRHARRPTTCQVTWNERIASL